MNPITGKYLLVRFDSRTKIKVVIFQSDEREELQQIKGVVESQIELTEFLHFQYSIEEAILAKSTSLTAF